MKDIVIPYTKKSKWTELKYALRSIEKNLLDAGQLIIVGDEPEDVIPDIFVPFPDRLPCKEHRILVKALEGAKRASPDFVFTNDDIYFLKPMYSDEIRYYKTGKLEDRQATFPYRVCIENTRKALLEAGFPQDCYEIHTPIVFDRALFPEVMSMYHFEGRNTLTLRSLYCNTLRLEGVTIPDTKNVKAANSLFFSTGDTVTDDTKNFLFKEFNEKSRWEK